MSSFSEAQRRPIPNPRAPGGFDQVTERFQRYYTGLNHVDLSRVFQLERYHYGKRIHYIEVLASSTAGRGSVVAAPDGYPYGPETYIPPRIERIRVDMDPRRNEVGRDFRYLNLVLDGPIFVESVTIVFTDDGGGHYPQDYIEVPIRQRFQGFYELQLQRLFGLDRTYDGMRVEYILVRARTPVGGRADLVINGRPEAWVGLTTYFNEYRLMPRSPGYLGRDIRLLTLQTNGVVDIESLAIKLSRY